MVQLDHPATVIAHRGASAYALEHTLAAYDLAVAMDADMIELDLRLTADGDLVASHDADLMRTAGDPRRVDALTRGDLLELNASVRPLAIDSVFERYGDSTRYCIEIKDPVPEAERRLVRAISRHGLRGRVLMQSFCELSLRRIGELDAALPLMLLLGGDLRPDDIGARLEHVADCAMGVGPAAPTVDADMIAHAHRLGLSVVPYTVNREAEMRSLLSLGVDGIFTDVPDRLRRVLSDRAERLVLTRQPRLRGDVRVTRLRRRSRDGKPMIEEARRPARPNQRPRLV